MLKVLGGSMILTGCLGMGFWYKGQFTGRIKALRLLQTTLELLGSEVSYGKGTLPECCGHAASKLPESFGESFLQVQRRVRENRGESFGTIFRECLDKPLKTLPLKDEDREIFLQFVPERGFVDGQMQLRMIEQSREQLKAKADSLERENGEKCRMAVGLGAMSGLLLILVLC